MGLLYEICQKVGCESMDNAMTATEFEERLLTIRETARSDMDCLFQMHCLVIELLGDLGYEDGADVYAETVIER